MPHVITQSCCNDGSCVFACPVNCIHPSPDEPGFATTEMLYIDPGDCIDCEACVPECPVEAIFSEANTPAQWTSFVQLNAERSAALKTSGGHITEKQDPQDGPECKKK